MLHLTVTDIGTLGQPGTPPPANADAPCCGVALVDCECVYVRDDVEDAAVAAFFDGPPVDPTRFGRHIAAVRRAMHDDRGFEPPTDHIAFTEYGDQE